MEIKYLQKTIIVVLLMTAQFLGLNIAHAQIGVGTTNPHPSAMMHISAGAGNNKGLIVPAITSANRVVLDSTQNIAHGLIFFDSNLQKFYYFHQSPRQWFELDHDWIRKDVAGASPVIGTHIYLGVPGNVGVGTAANINPAAKLTVVGNMAVGSSTYTQDSVPPANGATFGTWLGIGTRTQSPGRVFDVNGSSKMRGNLDVTGNVTGNKFTGEGVVPQGGIIMYSGDVSTGFDGNGAGVVGSQYEGWQICNGLNGSPDLRGRFVVGARFGAASPVHGVYNNTSEYNRPEYTLNGFGGAKDVALSSTEMPIHNHTGTTVADGSHQHVTFRNGTTDNSGGGQVADADVADGMSGQYIESGTNGDGTIECKSEPAGNHNHTFTTNTTGGGAAHENRPPFYVVAYIMKL